MLIFIDNDTRWNSTYNMLKQFLHLNDAISAAIISSKVISKSMKNSLKFSDSEMQYLKHIFDICQIFFPATKFLQGHHYSTIQFVIPYIFQIRTKLQQKIRDDSLVSIFSIL